MRQDLECIDAYFKDKKSKGYYLGMWMWLNNNAEIMCDSSYRISD